MILPHWALTHALKGQLIKGRNSMRCKLLSAAFVAIVFCAPVVAHAQLVPMTSGAPPPASPLARSVPNTPVPVISGKYAQSAFLICPNGEIVSAALLSHFESATATEIITGIETTQILGVSGSSQSTTNFTTSYSNTATTFTFGANVFNVVYGPVVNGIAESFVFNGIVGPCTEFGTEIRQH